MPPTNDFVPFCNENTGTNLPTQAAYLANAALPIGNQPGTASSSLNNKALRQATTIAAAIAQYTSNQSLADMLDNQNSADHVVPAAILGALTSALKFHNPVVTEYTAGAGNHNLTFKFQIATPTIAPLATATYSDGTTTYTVSTTVTGTQLDATGGASPVTAAGTLTKVAGTGDATLTYYAYRKPLRIFVRCLGAGGAGGGAGAAGAATGCGGAGGGGGGYCEKTFFSPASGLAYSVGTGGTVGAAGNTPGNGGGNTTFSTLTANGGTGGGGGAANGAGVFSQGAGGAGGASSGGDINSSGSTGTPGLTVSTTQATSGAGGASVLGIGGAIQAGSGNGGGLAGGGYGGGGGGGLTTNSAGAKSGGAGANGLVTIEEYYQ